MKLRQFQCGRSDRESTLRDAARLEPPLRAALEAVFSTKMLNKIDVQPRLRDKVCDEVGTSLVPGAYSVYTHGNGHKPSRVFKITICKGMSYGQKLMAIAMAVAEIRLLATNQLHFREYSDGLTWLTWVPTGQKRVAGSLSKPWDTEVLRIADTLWPAIEGSVDCTDFGSGFLPVWRSSE